MNILIVTDTYRPRVNGVAVSIDTFARAFRAMGHRVRIVAPAFPDAAAEPDLVHIPSHYLVFDPEDRLPNPWLPAARRRVATEILSESWDIIHTQTPFSLGLEAIRWARRLDCPIVHTYHTLFESYVHYVPLLPRRLSIAATRGFSRWYCSRMDLVVCPSSQMRDKLASYDLRTPIRVNPTGIPVERFRGGDGAAFRRKYGIPDGAPLLLFVGRVAAEKNIGFLLRMMERLQATHPEARLCIAGEGPAKNALTDMAERLGVADRVIFLGYFSSTDLAGSYAAADLFTFASVTETQGLVVLEAMAAGTPVVAVAEMGVAEVMAGERGGILVPHDLDRFIAAVTAMLEDRDLYARKQAETAGMAADWSDLALAERMLGHYDAVLKGAPVAVG